MQDSGFTGSRPAGVGAIRCQTPLNSLIDRSPFAHYVRVTENINYVRVTENKTGRSESGPFCRMSPFRKDLEKDPQCQLNITRRGGVVGDPSRGGIDIA